MSGRRKFAAGALILAATLGSIHGCMAAAGDGEILVSAAISLKNALAEIASLYEKRTGVRVRFNLGASGLLQKQIETGAPVDVFASAGESQMDALQAGGLIFADSRRNFARNNLVLAVPVDLKSVVRSFKDLDRPEIKRIAIGNPKTVPVGQYTRELLINLKLWDKLQQRLVLAENSRQVLDYLVRGEADAGMVFASDMAVSGGEAIRAATAPENSHRPIVYPIAIVKESRRRGDAQPFIDLIISAEGQAILRKHGFLGHP